MPEYHKDTIQNAGCQSPKRPGPPGPPAAPPGSAPKAKNLKRTRPYMGLQRGLLRQEPRPDVAGFRTSVLIPCLAGCFCSIFRARRVPGAARRGARCRCWVRIARHGGRRTASTPQLTGERCRWVLVRCWGASLHYIGMCWGARRPVPSAVLARCLQYHTRHQHTEHRANCMQISTAGVLTPCKLYGTLIAHPAIVPGDYHTEWRHTE
jgi:hypothetical protein